jgi:hypothetical protein
LTFSPLLQTTALGHTTAGAIQTTATFTTKENLAGYIRYVQNATPLLDLTGRTLTGWVYVTSTTERILVSAYAVDSTHTSNFVTGPAVTVNPGDTATWFSVSLAIPPAMSGTWDPTQVKQFGVQIFETATFMTPGPAVVAVDDYVIQ